MDSDQRDSIASPPGDSHTELITVADIENRLRQERKASRDAARAFEEACRAGEMASFYEAVEQLNDWTVDGWRLAMRRVARLPKVNREIKNAFLGVWIEHKMLPLTVGDRPALVKALRVLLPKSSGHRVPVLLFRGAGGRERRCHFYGFSWTSDRSVAEGFAQHWANSTHGGVLLQTLATPRAILTARENVAGYYEESEYVVDPYKLGKVSVIKRVAYQLTNDHRR